MASGEGSARLDVVRRGYDAFQTGDMDTLRSLLASDVTWHAPGQGPGNGEFHGVDNVIAEFGRLFQDSDGTFRVTVNETMEGAESVVVLASSTASRAGKTLDQPYAHIFHFDGDGHVSESWVIGYDQAASAAFWE
jgi:ketosteroid isomerase-like protein